jgi:hypothetical protein
VVTRHEVSPPDPSEWPVVSATTPRNPSSVPTWKSYVGLAESEDAAFRTVRVGLGSLKLVPGRGLTILGEPSPFWVDPLDEGAGPMAAPGAFPKLELPRGSEGSSSLQPAAVRRATANATRGEEVSVGAP